MKKLNTKRLNKQIPDYSLGSWLKEKALPALGDAAAFTLDSTLSGVGLGNVVGEDWYSSNKTAGKSENVIGKLNMIKNAAANIIMPGAGAVTGALQGFNTDQQDMQNNLNQDNLLNLNKTNQFNQDVSNRLIGSQQNQGYAPVAKQGGFIVYKGETHEGPNGGILVDDKGNPTGLSNNKPIAITEKNEVSKYDPETGNTYIYSDSLGFAKPAIDMVRKYKLDKSNSLYKHDPLLKTAVDKQFENLTTAQEFAKETSTPSKDAMVMFRKGGMLTKNKAMEMMKDGTANGKKLTPKQRAYFQAVAHGMPSKENGGDLPILDEGWNLDGVKKSTRDTGNFFLDPLRAWLGQPNSLTTPNYQPTSFNQSNILNSIGSQVNSTYTGDVFNKDYFSAENILQRNREDYSNKINQSNYGLESRSRINLGAGNPTQNPQVTNSTSNKPNIKRIDPYNISSFNNMDLSNLPIQDYKKAFFKSPGLAKGPTMPQQQEESFSPTLSPLGHIASAVGNLADYRALGKAKPENVSLSRVGAERINLSRQRLINERNASEARNVNTTNARNLGLNAGATFSNINAANTGVNKLLGQENALSAMTEENTNAQLRQQANMTNAELAAQESLFNTQSQNAYKMARARLNPLGNLARTAASYAADNASYKKGYDIAQMLSPNAEVFKDPEANGLNWLLANRGVKTRIK